MKIGIMLRHFSQPGGGVKNYTNNLLNELLSLESEHQFVLIYNNSKSVGTFQHYKNVKESAINIPSRLLWDQVGVPWIRQKEKIDIIFNPKLTLPLFMNCPSVFVCHGLNSYLMPWGAKRSFALHQKYIYPSYVAKAKMIIAVSETARRHMIDFLNVEEEKVHTVHLGLSNLFFKEPATDELNRIKLKYNLPEKFFLYAGQIYPPKNFGRLLQAFAKVGPENGIHLVVAGEPRWLFKEDVKMIDKLGISDWIINAGWVEHEELRYFYSLSEALVLPSLYEAFPSPIIEAMASRCPVVTSDRYGTKELAGDAGILVNPDDINDIANGMIKIIQDKNLRTELIRKGYNRSKQFSWRKCAEETLNVLEKAHSLPETKSSSFRIFKPQEKHKELIIQQPE
jgi:glycosyltransferase involved in cell wall biosynthesis